MSEATSTSFMKVPEMRLAIWDALIPPPRRIYMQKSSISFTDNRSWEAKVDTDFMSPLISIPSILQICAESRDYFIREKGYTVFSRCIINPIYVNYSRDQLWFDCLSGLWSYTRNVGYRDRQERRNSRMDDQKSQLSKIRKIGMSLTGKDRMAQFSVRIMIHVIRILTKLEEITFELPKDRFEDHKADMDGKLSGYEEKIRGHNILVPRAPLRLIYTMQEVVAPPEEI